MNSNSLRFWSLLLVGILALVGLGSLMTFLGRDPGPPQPVATVTPTPDAGDPIVAHINGQPIKRSTWAQAYLLDQIMSGISGQPPPTAKETLERLINEALLLEAFPPIREPPDEEIQAQIAALENAWGVGDDAVSAALEEAQLTRTTFELAVARLILVQESLNTLQAQGHEPTAWLEAQRGSAEITLTEGAEAMAAQLSTIQPPAPQPTPPPATLANTPPPKPTPIPPTIATAPSPTNPTPPAIALLETAPDFSLTRAGSGDTFELAAQLSEGPVVLVFFQKCG